MHKGNVFIDLGENSSVAIVIFESSALPDHYRLAAGDRIRVVGKVQSYRGSLEVIATTVERI